MMIKIIYISFDLGHRGHQSVRRVVPMSGRFIGASLVFKLLILGNYFL